MTPEDHYAAAEGMIADLGDDTVDRHIAKLHLYAAEVGTYMRDRVALDVEDAAHAAKTVPHISVPMLEPDGTAPAVPTMQPTRWLVGYQVPDHIKSMLSTDHVGGVLTIECQHCASPAVARIGSPATKDPRIGEFLREHAHVAQPRTVDHERLTIDVGGRGKFIGSCSCHDFETGDDAEHQFGPYELPETVVQAWRHHTRDVPLSDTVSPPPF